MIKLIGQELYKIFIKKSTYWTLTVVTAISVFFAIISKVEPNHFIPRELFASNYVANTFISLVLISMAATTISSEFEFNTMKNLASLAQSKQNIILSKWIVVLIYAIFLYTFFSVLAMFNKLLLFNKNFSITDSLKNSDIQLWQYWLAQTWSDFLTTWLILSVVFLVASILKKGSTAVIVGILGYFALNIIGKSLNPIMKEWTFLRWNPINFLNYTAQIINPSLEDITGFSNVQLVIGNLCYICLFLVLGLLSFKNKEL